jgi:hypothetical protein
MAVARQDIEDTVIGDQLARGLVREFLTDARARAAATERRLRGVRLQTVPSIKAACKIADRLESAVAPSVIARCKFIDAYGALHLQAAVLLPAAEKGLPAPQDPAVCIGIKRYIVKPGEGVWTRHGAGQVFFTRHCLERVIQRGLAWNRIKEEIVVALAVGSAPLVALAKECDFQQILLLGNSGLFVGSFEPELEVFNLTTFLPNSAGVKRGCDLVVDLAARLWIGDEPYAALMPEALDSRERSALFEDVLTTYRRHAARLQRPHIPGQDWYEQAREQSAAESEAKIGE